jgi:hypothetical protein
MCVDRSKEEEVEKNLFKLGMINILLGGWRRGVERTSRGRRRRSHGKAPLSAFAASEAEPNGGSEERTSQL